MQLNRDTLSKFPGKKVNSLTSFPKKQQTYIVAFALKETFDDLVTAQQAICNKRSPQASINSITPTNSLKLLDSTHTVKLEQIQNVSEANDKIVEENKITGTNDSESNFEDNDENKVILFIDADNKEKEKSSAATLKLNSSESNLEDSDKNKVILFIETDETTDSSNDENLDSNKNANNIKNVDMVENNPKSDQPEIIFNAINYTQRYKKSKSPRRKSKIHKIITPKCNKFKCKTSKITISSRLEKYYERAKQNSVNSDPIREGFSNISTVVSRTRVLKNGLAKENLLDETELSISNLFNENDDCSQSSYPSTAKNDSFVSNSSGKTLTYISSKTSSKNEDLESIGTVKSAIEMASDITPPYKTDVVAVAVAYNTSKNFMLDEKMNNNEKFMHLAALTSQSEPLPIELCKLTSKVPSVFEPTHTLKPVSSRKQSPHAKEMSDTTLVNKRSSFDVSSDDTFDMARTSSDFNESTLSTSTLKNDSENKSNHDNNEFKGDEIPSTRQQSLLKTVINLGYYPEVTPSTSSGVAVPVVDQKEVFITDTSGNYRVYSKNMGDHRKDNNINPHVLKKQFNERDVSPTKKPVDLPNHDKIKDMLIDDKNQIKHTKEPKITFGIPEMWDKLIIVLDIAFKRLETTIAEKIIKEVKNSIASLELRAQPIPEVDMDLERGDIVVIEPPIQEVISPLDFKETNRSLQCNLVNSEAIDKIMQTLSTQGPKVIEPGSSVKSLERLKSKLIRDYLEVLKPPIVDGPEISDDKGDTVTISTVRTETFGRVHRFRTLFYGPICFIKENLFVITSVPAFFIVLVFIYGILTLLIKP